jgi:RNA polymerase sigma factor (sigma-70 family)
MTDPNEEENASMATGHEPERTGADEEFRAVVSERRRLINLAYRLLGSLAEAEDAVQETYTRWYAMSRRDQDAIESPGAWLTTVAGRICLDQLGSARARRERYVGEWVPEPLPGPAADAGDPAEHVTLDESVSMAFLVVLESMTPAERVAFVLHDVFRYSFAEIADIVGRTPAACRQLASSARRRVREAQPAETPKARQAGIVRDFKAAWQASDIAALVGLLDPAAVMTPDGGGRATALPYPIAGGEAIARYLAALISRMPTGIAFAERAVNGRPGLVAQEDGRVNAVYAFAIAEDRITSVWAVLNPEKLRPWTTDQPAD